MDRIELAFALMAVVAIATVIFAGWRIYYGRERVIRRQQAADLAAYRNTMATKAKEE